jgi:geranylgeranyl diphosphate synthase type II
LDLATYQKAFDDHLKDTLKEKISSDPANLYDPIHYILKIGGKRLRPVLTLLSCDIFSDTFSKALNAALAIEMFHNFTLIHDDIMDNAMLRRGQLTVHEKWDVNTGILSGDALMILAYQFFEPYEGGIFKGIISLFNETAIRVCEGQQMDMDFEKRTDVSIFEYIKMIDLKTGVLVASALKMGAIIANAEPLQAKLVYDYGLNLGIAFQLQDDYLDTFGDDSFGKRIGGDILEGKKTFLVLKTLELANTSDAKALKDILSSRERATEENRILEARKLFIQYGVHDLISAEIKNYIDLAFDCILKTDLPVEKKEKFFAFGNYLMGRNK